MGRLIPWYYNSHSWPWIRDDSTHKVFVVIPAAEWYGTYSRQGRLRGYDLPVDNSSHSRISGYWPLKTPFLKGINKYYSREVGWEGIPIGPATSASRPEKTTSHSAKGPVGSHVRTMIACTASGISSANFQFTALEYNFPADRGLAPKAWMIKYGCELPMSEINLWPTARASQLASWIWGGGCLFR